MNTQIKQRFFNKVDKTDCCWNWTALRSKQGYGQVTVNELAEQFNVSRTMISRIKLGKKWRSIL